MMHYHTEPPHTHTHAVLSLLYAKKNLKAQGCLWNWQWPTCMTVHLVFHQCGVFASYLQAPGFLTAHINKANQPERHCGAFIQSCRSCDLFCRVSPQSLGLGSLSCLMIRGGSPRLSLCNYTLSLSLSVSLSSYHSFTAFTLSVTCTLSSSLFTYLQQQHHLKFFHFPLPASCFI